MTPDPRTFDDVETQPDRARAARALADAQRIAVAGHLPLDGDGLGSALGLTHALTAAGKTAVTLLAGRVPKHLRFLPGLDAAATADPPWPFVPDLLVLLDGGAATRFGTLLDDLPRVTRVLNVDHHVTNTRFGHVNWVDGGYAATGLMVYDLVRDLGLPLQHDAAVCLYTTLVTDTGRFSYSNTCPRTHRAAADLLSRGARPEVVLQSIYRCKSRGQLDLFARTIGHLRTAVDGRLAWTHVALAACADHGVDPGDTGDLIEIATSLEGVDVALLFREREGDIRVSVRTTAAVDATTIAAHFGGGGHPRAAGFPFRGPLDGCIETVVAYTRTALEDAPPTRVP